MALWRLLVVLALIATLPGLAEGADDTGSPAARAVALYDEGNYPGARKLLEEIDGAGEATGPLLYRLYYCQRATGDEPASAATLLRAVERLEAESSETRDLEVPFYLASAYENLGRRAEARTAAAATLLRVESGELQPTSGADKFRLGKLYADQGNAIEAANWYRGAVDAFNAEGSGNATYLVWASRYLAEQALEMDDISAAEMHLTELVRLGNPTAAELDQLAVVRVRNEMYKEAADAWRKAVPLNPTGSDRARYCAQLSSMAGRMKGLPATAPSGKAWGELTREELEGLLQEQANVVRKARTEAAQTPDLSEERLRELRQSAKAAKPVFVAAALEYALKGYNIREAAFFGGYAPLVFHSREWRIKVDKPAEEEQDPEGASGD